VAYLTGNIWRCSPSRTSTIFATKLFFCNLCKLCNFSDGREHKICYSFWGLRPFIPRAQTLYQTRPLNPAGGLSWFPSPRPSEYDLTLPPFFNSKYATELHRSTSLGPGSFTIAAHATMMLFSTWFGRSAKRRHGYVNIDSLEELEDGRGFIICFSCQHGRNVRQKPTLRIIHHAFKLPMVEMLRRRRRACRLVYVAMVVGVVVLVCSTTQLSSMLSAHDVAAARQHASCKLMNCTLSVFAARRYASAVCPLKVRLSVVSSCSIKTT